MKPSWDDAPDWATWLAMDSGGEWYWHENRPEKLIGDHDYGKDYWSAEGRYQLAEQAEDPTWTETLEPRP